MRDLKIINEHFPLPGSSDGPSCGLCVAAVKADDSTCDCLWRAPPPAPPPFLPFSATEYNIPKMKAWLLRHFASSTFNQCPHQVFPVMTGPPLEIHLDPDAASRYVSTPNTVPLHWQEKGKADIDRDVRMGVIEPVTQPSQWCHGMVVVRKHDGTPRRCVNLQPLNKHCQREEWVTTTPSKQVRSVPRNTYKTAWNGYHSVPLRVEDRHLITFITPWG